MADKRGQELMPHTVGPHDLRVDRPADPNLDELVTNWDLYIGRLVVLVGAGASIGAVADAEGAGGEPLPSAVVLRNEIWQQFMRPRGERAGAFDFANLGTMSLDQASAFAATAAGRSPLVRFLASRFQTRRPLWQHVALPFLRPNAVFTTNYDELIEQGWAVARAQDDKVPDYVPLFGPEQTVPPGRVPIYKPHGSVAQLFDAVGQGGPVITTIDYFKMLTSKRKMLQRWFRQARGVCVLLIGYSMSDMDIGGFLYKIRQRDNGHNWYAVFPRSDPTVRKYWAQQLRIQQIDRTFAEFMADLDAAVHYIPKPLRFDKLDSLRKRKAIQ